MISAYKPALLRRVCRARCWCSGISSTRFCAVARQSISQSYWACRSSRRIRVLTVAGTFSPSKRRQSADEDLPSVELAFGRWVEARLKTSCELWFAFGDFIGRANGRFRSSATPPRLRWRTNSLDKGFVLPVPATIRLPFFLHHGRRFQTTSDVVPQRNTLPAQFVDFRRGFDRLPKQARAWRRQHKRRRVRSLRPALSKEGNG